VLTFIFCVNLKNKAFFEVDTNIKSYLLKCKYFLKYFNKSESLMRVIGLIAVMN